MLANVCKEVGLSLVQDSKQYPDWVCNPSGWNIHNLGQFYQFTKAAITSMASTLVKSGKHTLDMLDKASPAWRKSKFAGVNLPAMKSPSIKGSTSAAKGKLRKSLCFSPLEKIIKALFSGNKDLSVWNKWLKSYLLSQNKEPSRA